jgi:AcrR family transcriptional regulator
VPETTPATSARRDELLELVYAYVIEHGMGGMSLRPLAAAIGTSPRVLLFLFGSKDEIVRAVLARARAEEIKLINDIQPAARDDLTQLGLRIWRWLSAEEHRGLLKLWVESYSQALIEPQGSWAGFAVATVEDWLRLLTEAQPRTERKTTQGLTRRTLVLAVLRGALLDLLATGDLERTTRAVTQALDQLTARAR